MTYYGDDAARFTRAVAELLHEGAAGTAPLADPEPTLAARDAVVAAIRTTYEAVIDLSGEAARGITVSSDPVAHPVQATAAALRALAPVAAGDVALSDVVRRTEPAWAAAAAAASALELHHENLWQLPPAAAWTATADLARLALAVPHLDRDLADRLPERDGALAAELRDARVYVALRVAASETVRLIGEHRDDSAATLVLRPPARALVVQYPHQLPDGLQRLTTILDNARAVSVRDYKLVAGAVARSALTAAGTLEQVDGPDVRPAIEVLRDVAESARQVVSTHWRSIASLAPPLHTINLQCRTIAVTDDALASRAAATWAPRLTLDIADNLVETTAALSKAVHRGAAAGHYVVPPDEDLGGMHRNTELLWVPETRLSDPRIHNLLSATESLAQNGADLAIPVAVARDALHVEAASTRAVRSMSAAAAELTHAIEAHPPATVLPMQHPRTRARSNGGRTIGKGT